MDSVRNKIVEEAKSWLGTPYHHNTMIKGVGVDCARLLQGVYHNCGVLPEISVGQYSAQWFLHRSEEVYLSWVEKYAKEIDTPCPGDIVVYRYGRCYAHGAVIIAWPLIIHAYKSEHACVYGDASMGDLAKRTKKFYSIVIGIK